MPKQKPKILEGHFTASNTVRDIIIGMSDGLTVPFALAAGLSGAVSNTVVIVIAGLAEIAAGCISMGLGGYLAGQNDAEHYSIEEKREYEEVRLMPDRERQEVLDIFKSYGLTEREVAPILETFGRDPKKWVDFMMRNELNLERPDKKRARNSGLTIAASYLVAGFIPLAPYIFLHSAHSALALSVIVTLLALIIFGYTKARLIGDSPWRSAWQTALIGSAAAGAAYVIAKLIA